jgi:hypothetical protein
MGLKRVKNFLINEDKYVYPYPELIIQSTRNAASIPHLGSELANNDNGYIYFYADSDWKNNPNVYIGESKNSIQSRHNSTHKSTEWFKAIKYPFVGVVNSPNLPWDTDTRRAIESKTVYKLHSMGIKVVNGVNSTWTNGGTVHPNVNNQYVEDVSNIIVDYITHHTGYEFVSEPKNVMTTYKNGNKSLASTSYEAGPKNDDVTTKKSWTQNPVSLKMLIEANILELGILTSTAKLYPATASLTEDGHIVFDGVEYSSISSAGIAAIRKHRPDAISVNGWDFWGVKQPDGSIKKLSSYRDEYKED